MQKCNEDMRRFNYMVSEIDALYHEAAVRTGISDSIQNILYTLCQNGFFCLQSELYKSGISRQTVNSAIRRLERDGIVYLESGKGRNTVVHMTEAGIAYAVKKIEPLYRIEDEIFSSWTPEERKLYLDLTARYCASMREKLDELPE